jgi:hypothetical protein
MKKIIFFLLAALTIFIPSVALAQNSPAITEKKSIVNEIAEVRRTYKGQLAEYRTAESKFTITKTQFEQLGTLASLEVAVQDTREVMFLRNQALLTYLKLMELELLEADGINLEEKNIALDGTRTLQKSFTTHQASVKKAVNRVAVGLAADDFEILAPQVAVLSKYVADLLRVGQLQTIYDQSVTLVAETDPQDAGADQSLKLNEKIRAHAEIKKLMSEVGFDLKFIWDEIREARFDGKPSKIDREISSVYAGLSQTLAFLEEILR